MYNKKGGVDTVHYLDPDKSLPVSLLLFGQFEDWLVGLHFPAAELGGDAALKIQLSSVGPIIHSTTESRFVLVKRHIENFQKAPSDSKLFKVKHCCPPVVINGITFE